MYSRPGISSGTAKAHSRPVPLPLQPKLSRQVSATEGSEGEASEGSHHTPEGPPATQNKGRITPSGLPPVQDSGTKKTETVMSPVQGTSKPLLEPPSTSAATGQTQPIPEQQKPLNIGPGGADDYVTPSHHSTKSKPANDVVPTAGEEVAKQVPAASEPSPQQQGNEPLPRTSSVSQSHPEDNSTQQPAPSQLQPHMQSQETVPASATTANTQVPPEKTTEGPQIQQQSPPVEGIPESQQLPAATTTSSFSTSNVTSSSSLNGSKKKASRAKKQLKLNLVGVMEDGVAKCTLNTVGGQVVKFQFSMEYDKPQEIFQKFVSWPNCVCLCLSCLAHVWFEHTLECTSTGTVHVFCGCTAINRAAS